MIHGVPSFPSHDGPINNFSEFWRGSEADTSACRVPSHGKWNVTELTWELVQSPRLTAGGRKSMRSCFLITSCCWLFLAFSLSPWVLSFLLFLIAYLMYSSVLLRFLSCLFYFFFHSLSQRKYICLRIRKWSWQAISCNCHLILSPLLDIWSCNHFGVD